MIVLLPRRLFVGQGPDNPYGQKARNVNGAWECTPRRFESVSSPIPPPILQSKSFLLLFRGQEI
jgi:hypothetical protein